MGLLALCSATSIQAQEVRQISLIDDAADLFVVVWDPVNFASYTRALDLTMGDFFWQGQQDAGAQMFWTLNVAIDANFQRLRNLGANVSDLRWAVLAFDNEGFFFSDKRAMTTLRPTATPGVLGADYRVLTEQFQYVLFDASVSQLALELSGPLLDQNLSYFAAVGQNGYFDGTAGFDMFTLNGGFQITNPVGSSSWFYDIQAPGVPGITPENTIVTVDEFDNRDFDGYWGMAVNPADNTFLLSYTLPQANPALSPRIREFAAGIGRTENTGGFAVRRLEGGVASMLESPAGGSVLRLGEAGLGTDLGLHLSGGLAVSPVPEPGRWALMLLGLAGVAALVRRRRV